MSVVEVKPRLALWIITLAVLLGAVAISAPGVRAYVTAPETLYNDPVFTTNVQFGTYTSQAFFSSAFMNETKYFLLHENSAYNLCIDRFDQLGVLENSTCSASAMGAAYTMGSDVYTWGGPERILIPACVGNAGCTLGYIIFNITNYTLGYSPAQSMVFLSSGHSNSFSNIGMNELSSSGLLNKAVNPWYSLSTDYSIAINIKKTASTWELVWNFLNPMDGALNAANTLSLTWTLGTSDINRSFVYGSEGNCFNWSDCTFVVLYEGRSNQNANAYGIYAREVRRGLFGNDFKDKPLIRVGTETVGTFPLSIPDLQYWYTSLSYDFLAYKIYTRSYSAGNHLLDYIQYSHTWDPISTGNLNTAGSNALQAPAMTLSSGAPEYVKYNATFNCTGIVSTGQAQLRGNYAYFWITEGWNSTSPGSNTHHILYNVKITDSEDAANSQNSSYDVLIGTSNTGLHVYNTSLRQALTINATSGLYNMTVTQEIEESNACDNQLLQYGNVYLDVFGDSNKYVFYNAGTSTNSMFIVTQDVIGYGEAYFFTTNYYTDFFIGGTNFSAIQTIKTPCVCSDYAAGSCYNSTHQIETRVCYPSYCSQTILMAYNSSCSGSTTTVPGSTTTSVPYAPGTPGAAGNAAYESWVDPAVSAIGALLGSDATIAEENGKLAVWTVLSIIVFFAAMYAEVSTSKSNKIGSGGATAPLVLAFLIFLSGGFIGWVPIWIDVVFIVLAGLVLAGITGIASGGGK